MIVYQPAWFVKRRGVVLRWGNWDGKLFRRHPKKEEGPGHRQGGLWGSAALQSPGKFLPGYHLALNGDQLPLEGQPQPPSLPAG